MPGPLIHMSNARHTARRLEEKGYRPATRRKGPDHVDPVWTGPDMKKLGRIMAAHPNFTATGAVGPDLFFFLTDFRDSHGVSTSSILYDVLMFLEKLYAAVDPFVSKWEKYLGPISEDTGEEMSRLTGGLSETIGDITGELASILINALEGFAVNHFDVLGQFSLGLDHGWDDQAYFWSDMLHYRRTAEFGRALWQQADAGNDDQLRAYALGYLTHVGADTTGHPYVNAVAGGPYRTHWTRHHLTENHIDSLWYIEDFDPGAPNKIPGYSQLTESAMYYDFAFDPDNANGAYSRPSYPQGKTMRDNWERRRLLDIDSELPDSLIQLLLGAIEEIYYASGVPHPKILSNDGRPTHDMVKYAYDLFYRLEKMMSVDGFSHEPPAPPELFPNLDFPTPTDPAGDGAPGSSDGGSFWDDVLDFLLSIINALAYIAEVAAYLATLPWAILADIATYPLRLGLYYALELPLYNLLKYFRAVMVMMGYFLPMKDEISPSVTLSGPRSTQESFNQVLAEMGDVFGGTHTNPRDININDMDQRYPHQLHNVDPNPDYRHPWDYPSTDVESCPTASGPYPNNSGPEVLFTGENPDPDTRYALETATNPAAADTVGKTLAPERSLGSAVSFSCHEIWLATRAPNQKTGEVIMTNWNLDGDRGYGYHCWDFNRDTKLPMTKDPDNKSYYRPCVWPPQATTKENEEPVSYNPALPQQVHWVGPGLTDPGCQDGACPEDEVPIIR